MKNEIIHITPRDREILWEIKDVYGKKFVVDDGLELFLYKNGQYEDHYYLSTQPFSVGPKSEGIYNLYVINKGKELTIKFGTNRGVKNNNRFVTAYGECKLKLDPKNDKFLKYACKNLGQEKYIALHSLYQTFGEELSNELCNYLETTESSLLERDQRNNLIEGFKSRIKGKLNELGMHAREVNSFTLDVLDTSPEEKYANAQIKETITKCPYCSTPFNYENARENYIKCVSCHNVTMLPNTNLNYKRIKKVFLAKEDLSKGNFSAALDTFSEVAKEDGNNIDPDVYFGKALAKFSINYIKDRIVEDTYEKVRLQPIFYGTMDQLYEEKIIDGKEESTIKKFTDDEDYKKIMKEVVNEDLKHVYEKKAEEIDRIIEKYDELKRRGFEYDCFISVKISDLDIIDQNPYAENKTIDKKHADEMYEKLKKEGIRPFYSEVDCKGLSNADYEAQILYALHCCSSMLVICSDERYLATPWMKNEINRYLHLMEMQKNSDNISKELRVIVCQKKDGNETGKITLGNNIADKYDKYRNMQSYSMTKQLGDIIDFVVDRYAKNLKIDKLTDEQKTSLRTSSIKKEKKKYKKARIVLYVLFAIFGLLTSICLHIKFQDILFTQEILNNNLFRNSMCIGCAAITIILLCFLLFKEGINKHNQTYENKVFLRIHKNKCTEYIDSISKSIQFSDIVDKARKDSSITDIKYEIKKCNTMDELDQFIDKVNGKRSLTVKYIRENRKEEILDYLENLKNTLASK